MTPQKVRGIKQEIDGVIESSKGAGFLGKMISLDTLIRIQTGIVLEFANQNLTEHEVSEVESYRVSRSKEIGG